MPPEQNPQSQDRNNALAALEAQVYDDLAKTSHPSASWLEPKTGPDGKPALDVLIVGGGQSGLATAFGLKRSQVTNILIIDKASEGREGPWLSYARMPTLRSPKDYTGPDLDIPSLTYQSWHEARFGKEHWQKLNLILRECWAEYLLWFRRATGLSVRNGCELLEIAPAANELLAATIARDGVTETLYARKIVLATGQEAMGNWAIPAPLRHLPPSCVVRASDDIDFAALAGKTVAVIGAGATAFDNAAMALEAGAADVHLLCRRAEMQVIQPYRWLTFRGFLRHFCDLDDAWRWRFMRAILELREGFPQATYDRCARFANFHLHEGWPVGAARELVSAEFARDTFENWKLRLRDLKGQWSPVQDTVNIADDPMVQANGYLLETVSHDGVPFTMVSTPVMFDKEQRTPGRAPAFNEHGDQILARELGLDTDAIIALKVAGVVA